MKSFCLAGLLALLLWSPLSGDEAVPENSPAESFVYKRAPQGELSLIVQFPPGWTASDKRPAIVFFFGGGWTGGSVKQFADQAGYLAGRGMVAARADYRVKSRHGVAPKDCVEDAKSAIRWLRQNAAQIGVDPDRIVAAGGSAGAHIAACTSLTTGLDAEGEDASISSKPNALVLFNPVLRMDRPPMQSRSGSDDSLNKAISPTLQLAKESPPALLLYGTADQFFEQGQEFMSRSKELGHHAELYTAEKQPHGFFNSSPWKERTLHRVDQFLTSLGYLTGEPTIDGAEGK